MSETLTNPPIDTLPKATDAAGYVGREPQNGLFERENYIPGIDYALRLSQERTEPYTTNVLGSDYDVLPGVFSPEYFAETAFYSDIVGRLLSAGDDYLDLGCGAGVTTVTAARAGANVVSLDINPLAVENTRMNAAKHGVSDQFEVRNSDVYSALNPTEKFDVIYWNMPFTFREPGTQLSTLEEAVYDVGFRKHEEFIKGAAEHLKDGGILLMGISSTLGSVEAVQRFAEEAGIQFEQVAEMRDPDTPPEVDIRFQLLAGHLIPAGIAA